MKISSNYKVEMVACSENFEIYIFDTFMNPVLNSKISGSVIYRYKDKPDKAEKLYHWGIEGFSLKGDDNFTNCTLTVYTSEAPLSVNFENNFNCVSY